ncbi:tetratricopeptide repeat protein [Cognatishimia sp. F0-27]|uniref:tetratricopeptide repeat protein n=1 Tax=Cognatishimia sp. F0-27 TaxID=2816855 RepID=UPI001D0C9D93|nr:tetratricopeptide repeat protein [Cognatishimia sp. F0-27]MCC1492585.1 tetratricopeptide repeat protein [Cognatishimia sp. F0-27]
MRLLAALMIALPTGVLAAGSDTTTPPASPACTNGKVKDAQSGQCVAPKDARLDDAERMQAVREYAYADAFDAARMVIAALDNPEADNALTYNGFIARKSGDMEAAMTWYRAALEINPDNILARSYMGQGFVTDGDTDAARAQLSEIRARGGRGTWAEASLRLALQSGKTSSY